MKTLFRVLGAAAAVAVTGAAIVVLDKVLNEKDPLHVEQVEFPEEAEKDTAEAEKVAEAYAEGEAKAAEPGDAWPPAFEKTPEAPAAEEAKAEEPAAAEEALAEETFEAAPAETPAEPAAEPETAPETVEETPAFDPDAPNPNPVEAGPAVAPKDENGKFDATKIADASDFGDWEEQGCKG